MENNPNPQTRRVVVFPGSFDPFHAGHRSVVERALLLFDEVVVGVGVNPAKHYMFTTEERVRKIQSEFAHNPRVRVEAYEGLTIDFARSHHALYIIKGVRNSADFEYEQRQAQWNKNNGGIETLLLFAEDALQHLSSTKVRAEMGK